MVIEVLPKLSCRVFGAVVACTEFAANYQATISIHKPPIANVLDSPFVLTRSVIFWIL